MNVPTATKTPSPESNSLLDASSESARRIDQARQRVREISDTQKSTEESIEKKRSLIEKLQVEIDRSQERRSELFRDATQAEIDLQRAEASKPQSPVSYKIALEQSNVLLEAFSNHEANADGLGEQERSDRLWKAADSIRDRLATTAVEDDARLIVLAIEHILNVMANWELLRLTPNSSNISSSDLGRLVGSNRRVQAAVRELQAILDGNEPPKMESIGDLIRQDVDVPSLGRMIGLMDAASRTDRMTLADLIDSKSEIRPCWICVRMQGTTDLDAAWLRRQEYLPRRKSLRWSDPMSSAHGAERPGRNVDHSISVRRQQAQREFEERQAYAAAASE